MSFWQNVNLELEYQGLSRKELSFKSGVPLSTINKGIQRNSGCYAVDALNIARALDVSLEYLLNMSAEKTGDVNVSESIKIEEIHLFHKYKRTLAALESLAEPQRGLFQSLIESFGQK